VVDFDPWQGNFSNLLVENNRIYGGFADEVRQSDGSTSAVCYRILHTPTLLFSTATVAWEWPISRPSSSWVSHLQRPTLLTVIRPRIRSFRLCSSSLLRYGYRTPYLVGRVSLYNIWLRVKIILSANLEVLPIVSDMAPIRLVVLRLLLAMSILAPWSSL
jgi:hypothetical protein